MLGDAVNDVGGCHGDGMIDEGVGSACKMAKVESLHVLFICGYTTIKQQRLSLSPAICRNAKDVI